MPAPGSLIESLESLAAALRTGSCLPWHGQSPLQRVLYTWVNGWRALSLHKPARTCGGPTAFLLNVVHNFVHSMPGMHQLLVRARASDIVEAAARVVLANDYLEAGTEAFFTHLMTAGCLVGTVTQHAHKFGYLFHSISQAIYYNHQNNGLDTGAHTRSTSLRYQKVVGERECVLFIGT